MKFIFIFSLILVSFLSSAHASNTFSSQGSLKAFKQYIENKKASLSSIDPAIELLAIAEVSAKLNPVEFNDLVLKLTDLYRTNQSDRQVYIEIFQSLYSQVYQELEQDKAHSTTIKVLEGTMLAYCIFHIGHLSKGAYQAKSIGLSGVDKWKHLWTQGKAAIPTSKYIKFTALAIGATGGGVQSLYQHLKTKKINPLLALNAMQAAMINQLAHEAFELLQAAKNINFENEKVKFLELLTKNQSNKRDLKHFDHCKSIYIESFVHLSEDLQPITRDINETEDLLKSFKIDDENFLTQP